MRFCDHCAAPIDDSGDDLGLPPVTMGTRVYCGATCAEWAGEQVPAWEPDSAWDAIDTPAEAPVDWALARRWRRHSR